MRKVLIFCLVALFSPAAALFTGCSGGGDGPGSHTLSLGGVSHLEGHTNPLALCASCHGTDLREARGRAATSATAAGIMPRCAAAADTVPALTATARSAMAGTTAAGWGLPVPTATEPRAVCGALLPAGPRCARRSPLRRP